MYPSFLLSSPYLLAIRISRRNREYPRVEGFQGHLEHFTKSPKRTRNAYRKKHSQVPAEYQTAIGP
jgi:hypothetical protein